MRHTRCSTNYCLRRCKVTKQLVCRFSFPFDLKEFTTLEQDRAIFKLVTKRNDPLVNRHNRIILQEWRANIDWQPIVSTHAVLRYIAKYAAKSEPQSRTYAEIFRTIIGEESDGAQPAVKAFQRLLLKTCAERDISAQEAFHNLMAYPMYHSSRNFVNLNLCKEGALRIVGAPQESSEEELADEHFLQRYSNREEQYQHISLMEMASGYSWRSRKWI